VPLRRPEHAQGQPAQVKKEKEKNATFEPFPVPATSSLPPYLLKLRKPTYALPLFRLDHALPVVDQGEPRTNPPRDIAWKNREAPLRARGPAKPTGGGGVHLKGCRTPVIQPRGSCRRVERPRHVGMPRIKADTLRDASIPPWLSARAAAANKARASPPRRTNSTPARTGSPARRKSLSTITKPKPFFSSPRLSFFPRAGDPVRPVRAPWCPLALIARPARFYAEIQAGLLAIRSSYLPYARVAADVAFCSTSTRSSRVWLTASATYGWLRRTSVRPGRPFHPAPRILLRVGGVPSGPTYQTTSNEINALASVAFVNMVARGPAWTC